MVHYNELYGNLLKCISMLSPLFSDSDIPYINYRAIENIFCKSFDAINISRSDTAFDAKIGNQGIGLKTFVCNTNSSLEKIAEFNSSYTDIKSLKGLELAKTISQYRNERIDFAKNLYNVDTATYHIVARRASQLIIFETDYDKINIDNIKLYKVSDKALQFYDGDNSYNFNFSKSTLFKKFIIPKEHVILDTSYIKDPYEFILKLIECNGQISNKLSESVFLPLYGANRKVYENSGLNQWNAKGRPRDPGEIYIPIPMFIRRNYPDFFPDRDRVFNLILPDGNVLKAKICQDGGKALMTNPNKALSDWLLRKLLKLKERELLTIQRLDILEFDSVEITKLDNNTYKIDKAPYRSYDNLLNEYSNKLDS